MAKYCERCQGLGYINPAPFSCLYNCPDCSRSPDLPAYRFGYVRRFVRDADKHEARHIRALRRRRRRERLVPVERCGVNRRNLWDRINCWIAGHGPTILGHCWYCGKRLTPTVPTTS